MVALAFPTYGLLLVGWFHLRLMAFTGFHSQTWMINRTTRNVNLYPYHCSLLVCLLVYMGIFWGTCARKMKKKGPGIDLEAETPRGLPSLPSRVILERTQSSARCGENFQQRRRQQGSAHLAIGHGVVEESVHILVSLFSNSWATHIFSRFSYWCLAGNEGMIHNP